MGSNRIQLLEDCVFFFTTAIACGSVGTTLPFPRAIPLPFPSPHFQSHAPTNPQFNFKLDSHPQHQKQNFPHPLHAFHQYANWVSESRLKIFFFCSDTTLRNLIPRRNKHMIPQKGTYSSSFLSIYLSRKREKTNRVTTFICVDLCVSL